MEDGPSLYNPASSPHNSLLSFHCRLRQLTARRSSSYIQRIHLIAPQSTSSSLDHHRHQHVDRESLPHHLLPRGRSLHRQRGRRRPSPPLNGLRPPPPTQLLRPLHPLRRLRPDKLLVRHLGRPSHGHQQWGACPHHLRRHLFVSDLHLCGCELERVGVRHAECGGSVLLG